MVRLAFTEAVFETKRMEGSTRDLYGVNGLFAKAHPAYAILEKAAVEVADEEWGAKAPEVLKTAKTKDDGKNYVIKDGSKKEYDGYADMFYVGPNSKTRPTVVNRDGTPLTAADGVIYGGCYADIIVEVYAYSHPVGGKGITSELKAIRFRKDGDAFGGGAPVTADQFSPVSEDDDIALE